MAHSTSGLSHPALASGFADPVPDAQRGFRTIMNALARPGSIQSLDAGLLALPGRLTRELAVVALTLADHDAPLWLDRELAADPAVTRFLAFHTGAPIVSEPDEAAFALCCDPVLLPRLSAFSVGTAEYPDRSTTVVLALPGLDEGEGFLLDGPGIQTTQTMARTVLPADLPAQLADNHALYPCGVDLLLVAPGKITGLPRSTRVQQREG